MNVYFQTCANDLKGRRRKLRTQGTKTDLNARTIKITSRDDSRVGRLIWSGVQLPMENTLKYFLLTSLLI